MVFTVGVLPPALDLLDLLIRGRDELSNSIHRRDAPRGTSDTTGPLTDASGPIGIELVKGVEQGRRVMRLANTFLQRAFRDS